MEFFFNSTPQPATAETIVFSVVTILFILLWIILSFWRKKTGNSMLRTLSRSWPRVSLIAALLALVLTVCRLEQIPIVSMRIWWIVLLVLLLAFAWIQRKMFKVRYYRVVPSAHIDDPRDRYLPGKK